MSVAVHVLLADFCTTFPSSQPPLRSFAPVRSAFAMVFAPLVLWQQEPVGVAGVQLGHGYVPGTVVCAVELLSVSLVPGLVVAVVSVPFVDHAIILVGVVDRKSIVTGDLGDVGVGVRCG